MDEIMRRGLDDTFRIHEATRDIVARYQQADAVLLPSLHEGLPNSVCEGMACGKPILMSAVCDAGNLVGENENGFLFSPHDPSDIADAIGRLLSLSGNERLRMGEKSRALAERYFSMTKFVDMYESVLYSASQRKRPRCGHWLPEVPQTALDFLEQAEAGGAPVFTS
jgi:glycosyltransferase involved in cell wall biosynthesis